MASLSPGNKVKHKLHLKFHKLHFIILQACFKQSFPVVTLYTNLGEDAAVHGINEAEVETVITSHELLPKFKKILQKTPSVKNIVYFENPIRTTDTEGYKEDVKLTSFWKVESLGKKSVGPETDPIAPSPETPCIIMYTSGIVGNVVRFNH